MSTISKFKNNNRENCGGGTIVELKYMELNVLSAQLFCKSKIVLNESESEVAQSCPTLCDCMDCSLPGSSIHGIFTARVLEWVAVFFSRGPSQPRD